MQRFNESVITRSSDSAFYSSVLRNTYLLLSLTLLFSSACAAYGMFNPAGFGVSIMVFIASFILLFVTSALRNSAWGILSVFAFTGCMGYSMGPLLNHFIRGYSNGEELILTALAGTGLSFFLTSAYVLVTKKDLSHWGKTLMVGLVICMVGMLANIFLKMPAMQLAISTGLTFISAMLMMYDTSRIIHGGETNYIMATISLFIDIQMMFQNLLMLLGAFNNRN